MRKPFKKLLEEQWVPASTPVMWLTKGRGGGIKIIIFLFSHTFVRENWDTRNTATGSSEPKHHLLPEHDTFNINPTLFKAKPAPVQPRGSPPASPAASTSASIPDAQDSTESAAYSSGEHPPPGCTTLLWATESIPAASLPRAALQPPQRAELPTPPHSSSSQCAAARVTANTSRKPALPVSKQPGKWKQQRKENCKTKDWKEPSAITQPSTVHGDAPIISGFIKQGGKSSAAGRATREKRGCNALNTLRSR